VPGAAEDLAAQLGLSAGRHAKRALAFYVSGEIPEFYLHAGTALELAVKAKLANHNPAFLAPEGNRWFGPALAFGRGKPVPPNLAEKIASVGANEAVNRLRLLDSTLGEAFRSDVIQLFELRNHVAHLGWAEPSDERLEERAASFVRAINILLRIKPREFWDLHADLAESLVADDIDRTRRTVELKRSAARSKVDMYGDLLTAVIDANNSYVELRDRDPSSVVVPCPVCGALGVAEGELVDEGEPDFEYSDGEMVTHWSYDLRVLVGYFFCRVCELELDGEDELEAADVDTSIQNPDAEPGDVYDYEDRGW
jgi:hypothetical protein